MKLTILLSIIVFVSCEKTSTDSNDDSQAGPLVGLWSETFINENWPDGLVVVWIITDDSIVIDYVFTNFLAAYTTDSTTSPKQIDLDFTPDGYTPFNFNPVPGIYKTIGQDSLVISVANSGDDNYLPIRPTNFNKTENYINQVWELTRVE